MRIFFLVGLTSVTLCNAASAHGIEEAIKLYESNQFADAVREFEGRRQETMRDSRSSYYYALSLNSAGRTSQAVAVCKQIMARFPKTEAAKQAKVAIDKWAHFNAVANASAVARARYAAIGRKANGLGARKLTDSNLGILGLKFEMRIGHSPSIKRIFPDTPAAKCLKSDDIIVSVDGNSTENLTKEEVYDLLVGDANTTVSVTVQRNGERITNKLTRLSAKQFSESHPEIWQEYLRNM